MSMYKNTPIEPQYLIKYQNKFWSRVNKKNKNNCWEWTSWKTKGKWRYGIFQIHTKNQKMQIRAHRASWYYFYGVLPPLDMFVCHSCDNPSCVNPSHLFLGTPKDNTRDMVNKQRSCTGSKNGKTKLNNEQVINIKKLLKDNKLTQAEIAKIFKISQSTINQINKNKTWKHVK